MFRRVRRTLSFRLTLWYFGLFLLSTVLLFGVTYAVLSRSLQRRDWEDMRLALAESQGEYQRGGVQSIKEEIAEKKEKAGKSRFLVRVATKTNTTLFLDSPQSWGKQFDVQLLETTAIQGSKQLLQLPSIDGDEEVLEVASVQLPDGLLLQVGKSTEEREDLLERFREAFIGVMLPVLLLSVTGGAVLTLRALRPLRGLVQTLHAIIATGALTTHAPVPDSGDELAELSLLFNSMLERISLLVSGMQSTLDNVAHDLRTPMTRLRGMAEVALQAKTTESVLCDALTSCIEESDRILTMLNTLMDISEAEHGAMRLERESLDAQELVAQAVELYRDVAEDKAIDLFATVPQGLFLSADRNRLLQTLTNLIDNAIKYTPQGGQVTLSATRCDSQLVLTITDTGVGIPSEDLPYIWDRLYRGDKSRSQRGLGLGLSFVKAIVQAHGGGVTVHSTPGKGSVFTVALPLS